MKSRQKEVLKKDYEERRSIMDANPDPRSNRRTYDVQESYG